MNDLNIPRAWGATFCGCWGMGKAPLAPRPQTPTDGPRLTHLCQQSPRSTSCWAPCWTARVHQPGVGRMGMGGKKQHCRGTGGRQARRQPSPQEWEGLAPADTSSPGQCCPHADGPGPPHTVPSIFYTESCWGKRGMAGVRWGPNQAHIWNPWPPVPLPSWKNCRRQRLQMPRGALLPCMPICRSVCVWWGGSQPTQEVQPSLTLPSPSQLCMQVPQTLSASPFS